MCAIVRAAISQRWNKDAADERYILGGENLTLKQILDKLAAITGLPSPKVKLPYAVALATGVVDTVFTGYLLRKEPRVTIDAVRMGAQEDVCVVGKSGGGTGIQGGFRGRWIATRSGVVPRAWVRIMAGRVAIVCAMEAEIKPLVRGWRKVRERGLTFFESDEGGGGGWRNRIGSGGLGGDDAGSARAADAA